MIVATQQDINGTSANLNNAGLEATYPPFDFFLGGYLWGLLMMDERKIGAAMHIALFDSCAQDWEYLLVATSPSSKLQAQIASGIIALVMPRSDTITC
eukprot:scaffold8545_cov129-Skeletonema_marinoi.AAC.8